MLRHVANVAAEYKNSPTPPANLSIVHQLYDRAMDHYIEAADLYDRGDIATALERYEMATNLLNEASAILLEK